MSKINSILSKCHELYLLKTKTNMQQAFSIFSHMTVEEKYKLYQLGKGKKTIVEIGSFVGASACCFGAASANDTEIYCIDTWQNDAMSDGKRDTWAEFIENTKMYSGKIRQIKGYSQDVCSLVAEQAPIVDLLFIDGDHSYEGVKSDWENYKVFLREGSIVVFHDYGWAEGVQKVVRDDVLPFVTESKSLPNMWWGVIGASL